MDRRAGQSRHNNTSQPESSHYLSVPGPSSSTSAQSAATPPQSTSGYVSPYAASVAVSTVQPSRPSANTARNYSVPSSTASSSGSSISDTSPSTQYSYSQVPPRAFTLPTFRAMGDERTISPAQKQSLLDALQTHRVNTIAELRRIERIFATLGSPDLTQPMTSAWVYYVNSNMLLTELRGLTRNYPFSSECLDEGKRRVHADPASNRSWNYCWLVLAKVHTDRLIPAYAQAQATRPEMWGGHRPAPENVVQLTNAFITEWTAALAQLLRHWETPPIR